MNLPHRSRGAAALLIRWFSWIVCVSLIVSALLMAAPSGVARAQADDSGLRWVLEVRLAAPAADAARQGLEETLSTRLSDPGVQVETPLTLDGSLLVRLSGSGGVEQLRGLLFNDLRGQVNFPAGGTELVLNARAGRGQVVSLRLNGNISTGYSWDWSALDPAQFTLAGAPQVQGLAASFRLGAPQMITAQLRAAADGDLSARLLYHRSWLPEQQPQMRLVLQADSLPSEIDLSDPQPVTEWQIPAIPAGPLQIETVDPQSLPANFDWRAQGKVTPIRDQGSCGSCWAFGIVGVLESALKVQLNAPDNDLSEQYLVNCNDYGDSCSGGWWSSHDFHLNRYIAPQTAAGSVTEAQLPYTAQNGTCAANYDKGYKLTEWHYINYSTPNEAAIKQAIMDYGPVGTAVCVGNAFTNYHSGVFATNETCPDEVNHAVVLVGWDDSTQSWIMRNSWDSWWGESGYMRIRYGTSKIGSYANYVSVQAGGPIPLSPTAGSVTANFTPEFTWQPVSGALDYQIQVSPDNSFSAPLVDQTQTGVSYIATTALSPNSQYYWRVRARLDGFITAWSPTSTLKTLPAVPVPVEPSGNQVISTLRPSFSWTQAGTAGKYDIQISNLEDFSVIKFVGTSTGLTWTPATDLTRNAGLFWRVRATGTYGASAWSSPGAAFATLDPPQPPSLSGPASGAILRPDSHPVFSWKPPSVSVPEGYHIQFSRTNAFEEIYREADVTGTSYTFEDVFEANRVFYWRVAAYNGSPRQTSAYTGGRSIKILPGVPALLDPVNTKATSLRPVLSWEAGANSPRYDVQVSRSSTCRSPFKIALVSKPELALTSSLPRLVTIYWRVRARGTYGVSAWSACTPFTTPDPPSTPGIVAPSNGGTLPASSPFRPTFVWKVSTNRPEGYILEFSPGSKFNPAAAVQRVIEDPAQTRLTWMEDLDYGVYAWRIRSYRSGPVYSNWSTVRTFKTQPGLQGTVTEPYLGQPAVGLTVSISGLGLSTITNEQGHYSFAAVPPGSRKLVFSAPDYIKTSKTMSVAAGGMRTLNAAVKKLPVTIQLDWTNHAAELDANLWLPDGSPFHINWAKLGSQKAFPFTQLIRETSNGYGPEPVVISRRYAGKYVFAVYGWRYGPYTAGLAQSGAVVKVYRGNVLVKTYTAPASGSGQWWYVFDLYAASGEINDINEIRDTSPGPYDPDAGLNKGG